MNFWSLRKKLMKSTKKRKKLKRTWTSIFNRGRNLRGSVKDTKSRFRLTNLSTINQSGSLGQTPKLMGK